MIILLINLKKSMEKYQKMLRHVLENGTVKSDRTETGTISTFGYQERFNLKDGFPLVTTKKIHWKSVVHELLWFISGDTNIGYLTENGVKIWDAWADDNGDLGPIYGKQWVSWVDHNGESINQLKNIIHQIKHTPNSRRLIVNSWNVGALKDMALYPCHFVFQFYCNGDNLSLHLNLRSNDMFLGAPFNIASYALLLEMVAQVTGKVAHELIYTIGDMHIYQNHVKQCKLQLGREPYEMPKIKLNKNITELCNFKYEDIELIGYKSHPLIKGKVAV
jgi:thymidylate synthase